MQRLSGRFPVAGCLVAFLWEDRRTVRACHAPSRPWPFRSLLWWFLKPWLGTFLAREIRGRRRPLHAPSLFAYGGRAPSRVMCCSPRRSRDFCGVHCVACFSRPKSWAVGLRASRSRPLREELAGYLLLQAARKTLFCCFLKPNGGGGVLQIQRRVGSNCSVRFATANLLASRPAI